MHGVCLRAGYVGVFTLSVCVCVCPQVKKVKAAGYEAEGNEGGQNPFQRVFEEYQVWRRGGYGREDGTRRRR